MVVRCGVGCQFIGGGLTPIYTDGTDFKGKGVTGMKGIKADKSRTATTDFRGSARIRAKAIRDRQGQGLVLV